MIEDRVWFVPEMDSEDKTFRFPGWEDPALFGNDNPVSVEYCSGNGDWIVKRAKEEKERNWVAVEVKFQRVRKIWSKLKNEGLQNLVVICGEGLKVTKSYFPSGSIDSLYVNFPDPWPKRRHAKNRIVREEFVEEAARITRCHGELTLVTDDPAYSLQMIDKVLCNPAFSSLIPAPHYVTERDNYGASWFEALWREKGKAIRFHQFRKVS